MSENRAQVSNYLIPSLLATLCCCLPTGVVALIFASQVNGKLASGDEAGAQAAASKAKLWCWISVGCSVLLVPITGILAAIAIPQFAEYQKKGHAHAAYAQLKLATASYDAYQMQQGRAPMSLADLSLPTLSDADVNLEIKTSPARLVAEIKGSGGNLPRFISMVKTAQGWQCVTDLESKTAKLDECQQHESDTGGLSDPAPASDAAPISENTGNTTDSNNANAGEISTNVGDGNDSATIHSQTGDSTSVDVHSNDGTGDVRVHVGKDGVTVETPDANKP